MRAAHATIVFECKRGAAAAPQRARRACGKFCGETKCERFGTRIMTRNRRRGFFRFELAWEASNLQSQMHADAANGIPEGLPSLACRSNLACGVNTQVYPRCCRNTKVCTASTCNRISTHSASVRAKLCHCFFVGRR